MTHPNFRAELQRLVNAVGAEPGAGVDATSAFFRAVERARAALSAASSPPPTHDTPVQLRPVDRYTLSDAILAAWHKHGNDSWCSIADEVIAALPPAQQQGAPSREKLLELLKGPCDEQLLRDCPDELVAWARNLITRYGGQAVPLPVADVRYEFSVYDEEDEERAGGSAPTLEDAQREGRHYLAMYGAPHRLEIRRVEALPLPEVKP